jgi:hypothetical protein
MPVEITSSAVTQVSDDQARLLALLQELLESGEQALARVNAVGEFPKAIALLLGQAVASGRALHALCVVGRARQAHPIARSMLENVINAHFMALEPEGRAKRFWAYRPIVHAQVAGAKFEIFGITDELEELRRQAAEARVILGKVHWSGKKWIRERSEECGLLEVWSLYYSEASAFVHGDASTWDAFAADDGGVLELGPSPKGIGEVVAPAISALFPAMTLLVRLFADNDLKRELEHVGRQLPEKTRRIEMGSIYERMPKVPNGSPR